MSEYIKMRKETYVAIENFNYYLPADVRRGIHEWLLEQWERGNIVEVEGTNDDY